MNDKATPRRRLLEWGPLALVTAVTIVMAVRQAAGFTRYALFFDDAWAALPAHESFANALQMTVSTPGWTLLVRWWIQLGTFASWWAQVPAYLCALAVGFSGYALARKFYFRPWPAAFAVVVLVTNPVTMTYATRVKPYTAEMLLAIALLWCGERLRREGTWRNYLLLAFASVLAFVLSFSLLVIIIGIWLAAAFWSWSDNETRRRWFVSGLGTGFAVLVIGIPFLVNRPSTLGENWAARGFMGRYSDLHHFVHNVEYIFAGLLHFAVWAPVNVHFLNGGMDNVTRLTALVSIFVVAAIVWLTLRPTARHDRPELIPVGLTVLVAVLLAFLDVIPLGDGRTDEVLYPVLMLAVAAFFSRVVVLEREHRHASILVAASVVVVSLLALTNVITKDARYPNVNVKGLYQKIHSQLRPGDVIVIPSFLSFSWAYADVTPWHVDLNPPYGWPQGFRVASNRRDVLLPIRWTGSDPQLDSLQTKFQRVWYIGYELGAWNPYAATKKVPSNVPMFTFTRQQLTFRGWSTSWFPTYSVNCYAEPMKYHAPTAK